jgi:hypothetical protein
MFVRFALYFGFLVLPMSYFFEFVARWGLCSQIYQILPRAKQLDHSVTISWYIGLAPFSFRKLTLKWFFFGLSFRLILLSIYYSQFFVF